MTQYVKEELANGMPRCLLTVDEGWQVRDGHPSLAMMEQREAGKWRNRMSMIQRFKDGKGRLLAIFVLRWQDGEGTQFFTDPNMALQLGWMRHAVGKIIPAHTHPDRSPSPDCKQPIEVLLVTKGKVRVDLYGDGWEIQSQVLEVGDVAMLIAGGHGLEVLEAAELWEIRGGPYLGKDDKVPLHHSQTQLPPEHC